MLAFKKKDVEALYWTGVAWASAISMAKDDMDLVGDLSAVDALMNRALELDETWGEGALHEFYIAYSMSRNEATEANLMEAERHFKRAMELNGGRSIGPLVSYAENICVKTQDRKKFKALLQQALAFDVDQFPEKRLTNILAQKKAVMLLSNIENLFFVEEGEMEPALGETKSK